MQQDALSISPLMTSQPYLEEADLQIILHVMNSIESGFYVNIELSNDADVLLHYRITWNCLEKKDYSSYG